jgi:hypothetical protein
MNLQRRQESVPGRQLHVGEYARNTQEPARNTQEYASENTYSAEYVFCAGISLVLVWLACVLREEHFSAFLHVVYSVLFCVYSRVFLRIQCILFYSVGVFCKSRKKTKYVF